MAGKTFKEYLLRAVALLGLLAVLLLGAWGIIQIAFFISSLFNNAGGHASNTPEVRETMTISLPTSVTAGQEFTIRWGHQGGSGNYGYAVAYSCASGLSFKAKTPAGTLQQVPCDTPFNFTGATSSMALVATASSQATTSISVAANQLSTGKITTGARGNLTILTGKPATTGSTGTKPTTTTKPSGSTGTYVSSGRYSNLYGLADLAVYVNSSYMVSGNGTVEFVIQNVGTNVTPTGWSFNSLLPIQGSYTYPSGPQQALYPGDKIVYTLNFYDPYGTGYYSGGCTGYAGSCLGSPTYNPYDPYYFTYGYGGYSGAPKSVTIMVDPYNQIPDGNRANNTATTNYIPR